MSEPVLNELRLVRIWNIERAAYDFRLEKFFKNNFGYLNPENNPNPPMWHTIADSQEDEWAKRNAEHFKIDITELED